MFSLSKQTRNLLAATSLINLAITLLLLRDDNVQSVRSSDSYSYLGHDFPDLLPLPSPLEPVLMTVEDSVHYPLLGHTTDAFWNSMTPQSGGFVRLGPNNRFFLVSMFHQVHCLRFFNWAFDPDFEGQYKAFATHGHNSHCLNYLRQIALCSSDLTLERGDFMARNLTSERVGATHVCQDWSKVYDYVDKNHAAWKNVSSKML